jgi:hypothetical protein
MTNEHSVSQTKKKKTRCHHKDCCSVSGGKGANKLQHSYWTKCEICPGKTRAEDITKVNVTNVKNDVEFCETKQEEKEWRLNFVKEIVNVKNNILNLDKHEDSLTTEELEEILHCIYTS